MRFEAHGRRFRADVGDPVSIAIPLDFGGTAAVLLRRAARRVAARLRAGAFVGDTRAGGSCNCEILTLAPHCNGTHTECVGHVTEERVAVSERVPGGLSLARLVTVAPVAASDSAEGSDPAARARRPPAHGVRARGGARERRRAADVGARRAHTGPMSPIAPTAGRRPRRTSRARPPPCWSARGIETLVLDLPSADRADDGGKLTAHRVFFGLPPGSRRAADASRPRASITELAWIGPGIPDGLYLLDLQLPAFLTDAAPSRPLLFAVHAE